MSFSSSVISYPSRGPWGNNKYRGNCSGYVIKDFLETYHNDKNALFVDPSMGGGTSLDVARDLGINFKGFDLSTGFNLLTDSLLENLGEEARTIFWHPPYHDMIKYSGKHGMWGEDANKYDISNQASLADFVEACAIAFQNIYDSLEMGGAYGILIGNQRKQGKYLNLSSILERFCPGELVDEIIKIQHNCVSDRSQYNGRFVRIQHEKLLVFKKIKQLYAVAYANWIEQKQAKSRSVTWRSAIRAAFIKKPVMHLSELYSELKSFSATKNNNNYEARIRNIVQDERYFKRLSKGTYTIILGDAH